MCEESQAEEPEVVVIGGSTVDIMGTTNDEMRMYVVDSVDVTLLNNFAPEPKVHFESWSHENKFRRRRKKRRRGHCKTRHFTVTSHSSR